MLKRTNHFVARAFLALAVCTGMLLAGVPAALAEGEVVIDLAAVSADGAGYTYSGGIVTITAAGSYIVTGTAATAKALAVADNLGGEVNLTLSAAQMANSARSSLAVGENNTVNLILSGTSRMESMTATTECAGIAVPETATLTISGTGELTARGYGPLAGIGGGEAYDGTVIHGGTIVINGGTVKAFGGNALGSISGSGIRGTVIINGGDVTAAGGNTADLSGSGLAGTVTVNGGTVTATGGSSDASNGGAGIGGSSNESGGVITINGGSVTATGAVGGAGIGGGYLGAGGDIRIHGGTVVAIGSYAAGIGGGQDGAGGTVLITDQSGPTHVKATGKNGGAGIGGGNATGSGKSGGTITIEGGTVIADGGTSAGGAGIGGGIKATSGGEVIISGGDVTATGAPGAAGIGGGKFSGNSTVRITGGQVTATGGSEGAGIGSGYNNTNGGITGGTITISGGTVNATGGSMSAGIGGGNNAAGGVISITDGTVTVTVTAIGGASGGAGIGGGANQGTTNINGSGGTITIGGGTVTAVGTGGGAGIGGGKYGNTGAITINGGRVTAQADSSAAGIGSGDRSKDAASGTNTVTVNGGRVYATGTDSPDIGGNGTYDFSTVNTFNGGSIRAGSVKNAPVSGASQALYKTVINVIKADLSALAETAVTYKVDDATEGIASVTDEAGKLYLWLPATPGGGTTYIQLESGGTRYIAAGQVTSDNLAALNAIVPIYTLALLSDQTFSDLTEGYTPGTQQTKTIRITNAGTGFLTNFNVSMGAGGENFILFVPPYDTLAPGAYVDITVSAASALAGGDYTADVTVQADNMDDTVFHVSQSVKLPAVKFMDGATTVTTCSVHYNTPVAAGDWPADRTKPGFLFLGWFTDSNVRVTADTLITGDLTLNARWATAYAISYDLKGGAVTPANPVVYAAVSADITLVNPAKTGYIFAGWSGTDITNGSLEVTIPSGSTGARTYTASWAAEVYEINYLMHDGVADPPNPTEYTIESPAITLVTPTRAGYTFSGWAGSGITGRVQSVTIPAGSTGVRGYAAGWTAIDYSISYSLNGGSVSSANPVKYTVESGSITLVNPTKRGYTFAGWSGTDITGLALDVTIPTGSTGPRSYTANWTVDVYEIAYFLQGGVVSAPNPVEYTIESPAITLVNPTRASYTFTGWSGTGITGTNRAQSVTIPTGSTGDRGYAAHWKTIDYSISYSLNGGSVSSANPVKYTVESGSITLVNPTRAGYTFAGWSGTDITGLSQSVTISTGSKGDREYAAHWTVIGYTIRYELNGGAVSPANPAGYTVESAFTLTNPTRASYIFAGWSGTGIAGVSQSVTVPAGSTGNRDYTANWALQSCDISVATNDAAFGSVSGAGTYNGGAACTVTAVPQSGCRFVCWAEGGAAVSTDLTYTFTVTVNRSLVAVFDKIGTPEPYAASAGYSSIQLTWPAVPGANGYHIYRAATSGGKYTKIATVTDAVYTNTGLTCGTAYYYKIQAYCVAGGVTTEGGLSAVKAGKPIPLAPSGLSAARASSTSARVSWAAVSGATKYEVYRAMSLKGPYSKVSTTSARTFTNKSLKKGKTYYYKVRAYRQVKSKKYYGDYSAVVPYKVQ